MPFTVPETLLWPQQQLEILHFFQDLPDQAEQ